MGGIKMLLMLIARSRIPQLNNKYVSFKFHQYFQCQVKERYGINLYNSCQIYVGVIKKFIMTAFKIAIKNALNT